MPNTFSDITIGEAVMLHNLHGYTFDCRNGQLMNVYDANGKPVIDTRPVCERETA